MAWIKGKKHSKATRRKIKQALVEKHPARQVKNWEVFCAVEGLDIVERKEEFRAWLRVNNKLRVPERRMFELYFLDDFTLEQVGRSFNKSKQAVHKDLMRLVDRFRTSIFRMDLLAHVDPVFGALVEEKYLCLEKMADLTSKITHYLRSEKLLIAMDLPSEVSGQKVANLDLSVRAKNVLLNNGIRTVGEIAQCTRSDILILRDCGKKTLKEIEDKLEELGLHFSDRRSE